MLVASQTALFGDLFVDILDGYHIEALDQSC